MDLLAWPGAKYALIAAVGLLLHRWIGPGGRALLAEALADRAPDARDGLPASWALLTGLSGVRLVSGRYVAAACLLTLIGYALVFTLGLAWSHDLAGLMQGLGRDGGAAASALRQMTLFMVSFGPVASLFGLACAQATVGWLLAHPVAPPTGWRPAAFAAATGVAMLATLFALYLAALAVAGPAGPLDVLTSLERAGSSLLFALDFELIAGVYVYAAFATPVLALSAAVAARLPLDSLPGAEVLGPVGRAMLPLAAAVALGDLAVGF
ncbi:MAG: hypothetical protein AAF677_00590 [Pseudomonadota bacterium]